MSCVQGTANPLENVDDATAAAAFRRLVGHLRHRTDAQNVELMGLAGFYRNCLGDWLAEESGGALTAERGREAIYGMSYAEWKATHQLPASEEQIMRMAASMAKNAK